MAFFDEFRCFFLRLLEISNHLQIYFLYGPRKQNSCLCFCILTPHLNLTPLPFFLVGAILHSIILSFLAFLFGIFKFNYQLMRILRFNYTNLVKCLAYFVFSYVVLFHFVSDSWSVLFCSDTRHSLLPSF